ncbi:MAG: RibD family protein, partial [Sphingobacteriales bacterium]
TNIGGSFSKRLLISNAYTNRLVHKWRSEEAAILVGTNTALYDNPSLTNRHWSGVSPARLVLDMQLRLPQSLHLFNKRGRTIVFNGLKSVEVSNCHYYRLDKEKNIMPQLLEALYELGIQSVLVEGGAKLLQSFIDHGAWDEARVITNKELSLAGPGNHHGTFAPILKNSISNKVYQLLDDQIQIFKPATR